MAIKKSTVVEGILVDMLGLVLVILVQAANIADVVAARTVVMAGKLSQPELAQVWAFRLS
ncbi:hypothetical protein [Pseudanabaena sp. SR411]|uniref:hypothetical protein n=1 Tax=Pseudanabaena sp. SR411 TaxID=1980935 RepID=UPI00114026AA|nr:hypothetical protein [Pseudanabaena sp. SR411]